MILFAWLTAAFALLLIGTLRLLWGLLRVLFWGSALLAMWGAQAVAALVAAVVAIHRERQTH